MPTSPLIKTICRSPLKTRCHVSPSTSSAFPRPTRACAGRPNATGLVVAIGSATGAINRYPRLGMVSMKRDFLGRSPRALRTARTCRLTACGSTTVLGHTALSSSLCETRRPRRSTKYSRTAKALGVSRMRSSRPPSPRRQRDWFSVSSRNAANSFIGDLAAKAAQVVLTHSCCLSRFPMAPRLEICVFTNLQSRQP